MCFYYGYSNFILGMKLPKYNLVFVLLWERKARLVRIATGNLNDNTKNRRFECLLILLIFKAVVSDNDQPSLFQTHRFTKTSVVLRSDLIAANNKGK